MLIIDPAEDLVEIDHLLALALQVLSPPAATSLWDWCCTELTMPSGGRFDLRRAALMRSWYDLISARISGTPLPLDPEAHRVEQVWLVLCAQIAKTTLLNAAGLWAAAHYPRKIGFVMKRIEDLKYNHNTRLLPIIDKTPALDRLLPQTEEAREQALHPRLYRIAASFLFFLCGSVSDDWRSQDLELMLEDEFDRYPDDVDGQGDPIDLGLVRQRTYPHTRLTVGASTPTTISRHAWRRLCSGTHQRPLVLCPSCGAAHYLSRRGIVLADGRELSAVAPAEIKAQSLARYVCHHCGELHDDHAVRRMVLECERAQRWVPGTWDNPDDTPQGRWLPDARVDALGRLSDVAPPRGLIRTGWAGALYSVDVSISSHAAGWAAAQLGTEANKQAWTNTEDAEPYLWIATGTSVDEITEHAAAGYAPGALPALPRPVAGLVLAVDQQGNNRDKFWYAWILRAFVQGGESWGVHAGRVDGFAALDALQDRLWPVAGASRSADLVVMDSANPNFRHEAYLWANEDRGRRVLLRGDGRLPIEDGWLEVKEHKDQTRRSAKPPGVREYRIHPHLWRSRLQECMLGKAGAKPWHMPSDMPDWYLKSLNAEEPSIETRRVAGQGFQEVLIWQGRVTSKTDDTVTRRKDLHWASCEKMALAIADIQGWNVPPVTTGAGVSPGARTPDPAEGPPEGSIDDLIDEDWGKL